MIITMRVNNTERFLVGYTVLLTFWAFFTGFHLAYNGFVGNLFWGRIGVLLNLGYLLTLINSKDKSPDSFNTRNVRYVYSFGIVMFLIVLLTWISAGVLETFFILAIIQFSGLVLLNDRLRLKCFDIFVRILAVILTISLLEFIVYSLFGVGIVLFNYIERTPGDVDTQIFKQLLFNLIYDNGLYYRFQCICEEPGVVGTTCGLLIFLLKDLKKYRFQYYVFIVSGVFSFSLAFYALFLMHLFSSTKINLIMVFISGVALSLLIYYFHDFFDFYITNRLVGRSLAEVDNRSTYDFSLMFQKALKEGQLWFGIYGGDNVDGAGVKIFIWRYGIVSVILLFFVYFKYYRDQIRKYKPLLFQAIMFFLAFWISFYQRHNITSMEYLMCFLLAPLLFSTHRSNYIRE